MIQLFTAQVFSPILVLQTNTNMKVLKSHHISPFGGLNFVLKEFDVLGVGRYLNESLGVLPNQAKYDWRDLFYSFWSVFFCGGDCAEDLDGNFKNALSNIPNLNVPSPDRVLERMKKLSEPTQYYETPRGVVLHQFNHNHMLNKLNINLLKRLAGFKKENVTLDYDNTLIFNNKADAKKTYKKQYGYAPGVGMIGKHVVYVENRNGNSDAQTLQNATLQRMFDHLTDANITIERFRADAASYQLDTISTIRKHVNKFYIRARLTQAEMKVIAEIDNWKQLDDQVGDRGDIIFTPFKNRGSKYGRKHLLAPYRLVVTREKRRDGQLDVFTGEAYHYSAILTSDLDNSNDYIVNFYNQRGGSEREFDVMKNDFSWSKMPFSKLEQNSVFLLITAICRNLYNHIITVFSRKFRGLAPSYRVKKFIFRFICIPAKWVKSGRSWKLKVYGKIAYRT